MSDDQEMQNVVIRKRVGSVSVTVRFSEEESVGVKETMRTILTAAYMDRITGFVASLDGASEKMVEP